MSGIEPRADRGGRRADVGLGDERPAGGFDPRAKAAVYGLGTVLIVLATEVGELLVAVAVLAALLLWRRLGGRWAALLWPLLPTLLLFGLAAGWAGGPAAAAGAMLRLLALMAAGVLFFATTPPEELGDALLAGGVPHQVAFLLEGTLRFVPTLGALAGEVRDAQASRGIRLDGLHLLRNGPALLAPTLVGALRLADDLAEALEARGFGGPTRTPLRDYRFAGRDWLLVGAMALASLAVGAWLVWT